MHAHHTLVCKFCLFSKAFLIKHTLGCVKIASHYIYPSPTCNWVHKLSWKQIICKSIYPSSTFNWVHKFSETNNMSQYLYQLVPKQNDYRSTKYHTNHKLMKLIPVHTPPKSINIYLLNVRNQASSMTASLLQIVWMDHFWWSKPWRVTRLKAKVFSAIFLTVVHLLLGAGLACW